MTVKPKARNVLARKARDVYLVFFSSIGVMPFSGGRSSLAGIPEKKIVKYPITSPFLRKQIPYLILSILKETMTLKEGCDG